MSSDMEQKMQDLIEGGISESERLHSEVESLKTQLAAAQEELGIAESNVKVLEVSYHEVAAKNLRLAARLAEAERRIAELQSEVACEERRFNAQYDLLAEVSKRAEDAAVFLQDEIKKAADWYTAYCEVKEEFGCLESRLRDSEGRKAVLVGAGYRDLVEGDVIQEGDEWFNPDWEVGGPWFTVKPETGVVGQLYKSTCRPMRRIQNPTHTAAVLTVLDAAIAESKKHGAGNCNCLHGCGCVCGCELCKAIRDPDKEV